MSNLDNPNIIEIQDNVKRAADLLNSLSNPARLLILCRLVEGEKSVGELLDGLDLAQSALSQHLARLRKSNLVTTRRQAQKVYYSIKGHEALEVLNLLHRLYCNHKPDGESRK